MQITDIKESKFRTKGRGWQLPNEEHCVTSEHGNNKTAGERLASVLAVFSTSAHTMLDRFHAYLFSPQCSIAQTKSWTVVVLNKGTFSFCLFFWGRGVSACVCLEDRAEAQERDGRTDPSRNTQLLP